MLDSIFTDHMVLQRNKPIRIYGTEYNKDVVDVFLGNQKRSVKVSNGKWIAEFEPLSQGGPFEIKIDNGLSVEKIQDVVIGDVFLAAGQSNMEFLLKNTDYYHVELESSIPEFRYFYVNPVEYTKGKEEFPKFEKSEWQISSAETIGEISAIAYYFAKQITRHSTVPVGIVGCHKGGTSASCWIDEMTIQSERSIKEAYYDAYWNDIQYQTETEEDKARETYFRKYNDYQDKVADYLKKHPDHSIGQMKQAIGHTPWPGPKGEKDYGRPCGLYHTMFEKIKSFTFCSVIWYQGEEDTKLPLLYEDLLKLVINSWRNEFHDVILPFYVIQLPDYNDDKSKDNWAIVRQAQEDISKALKNVHLVCSLGCGEEHNIHPTDKSVLGKRIGDLILETYYGLKNEGTSPMAVKTVYTNERLEIEIANLYDQNLVYTGREKIEISNDGVNYQEIEAFISGSTIYANVLNKPLLVRYAWKNYPKVGFERKDGKPLFPFFMEVSDEEDN